MTNEAPAGAPGHLRLFCTTRSPFSRKVLVAAHEIGLGDKVERVTVLVTPDFIDPKLASHTALGMIPTLLLPDDTAVYDSVAICDWLDAHYAPGRLVARDYPARLDQLRREAIGDGLADRAVKWLDEKLRPAETQIDARHATAHSRVVHTLDALEKMVGGFAGKPFDVGMMAIATSLAYLDFRFADVAWREGRPVLAAWFAGVAERPSMKATEFVGAPVPMAAALAKAAG